MNWIKSLFCKHEYRFVANIHGDQINYYNGKRSIWKCSKCGKIEYRDNLYYDTCKNYKLCTELDKLYDECYSKRYEEWQLLRSETLNKMQAAMRNLAFNGQCWYDVILFCEEIHNDKNYYEKWLYDNGLKFNIELEGKKCLELNKYKFHIHWKN